MFHSVSLLSQAPLARGSCALPSVFFFFVKAHHIRESALALQDGKFLAKLSAGDIPLCLASLYKKTKPQDDHNQDDDDKINQSIRHTLKMQEWMKVWLQFSNLQIL